MGKSSIVIPFIGTILTSIIVYILRNNVVNELVADIANTNGNPFIAYLLALVNATLLLDMLLIFYGTWFFSSILLGYLTREAKKGILGGALMIPTALLIFLGLSYMNHPISIGVFINQQVIFLLENTLPLIIGIAGCGTLGGLVGRIRKEPILKVIDISEEQLSKKACPKCKTHYYSNPKYCSQCGTQISQPKH